MKALQPSLDGYLLVNLYMDGKVYPKSVHNLVCLAFHGAPPPGCDQARHFPDQSKTNNTPGNLSWTNAQGNADDRRINGTHPIGSKNGFAKLTESGVAEIKGALRSGTSRKILAEKHGVSVDTINLIALGKTWSHVNAAAS